MQYLRCLAAFILSVLFVRIWRIRRTAERGAAHFLRARGASDKGYRIRPVIFLHLVYRLLARIVSSWVEQR